MKTAIAACLALMLAVDPAIAQAPFTAQDLLIAAGLTPHSTARDAARLFGRGQTIEPDGIEFLKAGSLADAWMTFRPAGQSGGAVYVDCDETPAALPDDAIKTLCGMALGADWHTALPQLKAALRLGRSVPGAGDRIDADDNDADDDEEGESGTVVVLSRVYRGPAFTVTVSVTPKVATPHDGSSHAGVLIAWTPV